MIVVPHPAGPRGGVLTAYDLDRAAALWRRLAPVPFRRLIDATVPDPKPRQSRVVKSRAPA